MIWNTTHKNEEYDKQINALVGPAFSLMRSIRMKGVGSKRMIIDSTSVHFEPYLNAVSDLNYANIELRPLGVLVHINKGHQNFSWGIPYYQLAWYKTGGVSIHGQGRFIQFRNNKTLQENKKFFDKLLKEKIRYDDQHNLLNFM
ncbi:MAG: hypothetical protein AAF466_07570 [Bacteroidota bacterium]